MNRLAIGGLVVFAVGVAAMVAPGVVPVDVDRALVYLVGLVALVQAYRVLGARRRSGIKRATTPDPEVPRATPVPGADLNEAIRDLAGGHGYYRRQGLKDSAVAVITRYDGLSEAEARTRLEEGTWTDDPIAAAHLGDRAPRAPLRAHLRRVLHRESGYEYGRRRAIEAIAAKANVSTVDDGRRQRAPDFRPPPASAAGSADEPEMQSTGHWRGVSAVALVAVGIGIAFDVAPVVLSGVAGVGFAAYARSSPPPAMSLSVGRSVDADRPEPGDRIDVELTVTNDGDRRLPDLRIVDGVPPALEVVDGSPRLGTTLGAGESASLTYAVEARRGVHEFEPVTVVARDLPGSVETVRLFPEATTLTCIPPLKPTASPVPLRAAATQFAGRVQTSTGGEGVEFYATRTYQPGDPMNRIDWNRRARTGEFATLEFREERSATVVVVIDARSASYVSHEPYAPHALDRSVEAAGRVVASLLEAGDRVGVGTFGADTWLPPSSGREHRARIRQLLATDPAFSWSPPGGPPTVGWRRRLARRLPTGAQLVVISPLCDGRSVRLVRTLDAAGHPASVISPDPTLARGLGPLLATVARRVRITDLRRAGVPVVDWPPGESLDVALAQVERRRLP